MECLEEAPYLLAVAYCLDVVDTREVEIASLLNVKKCEKREKDGMN